MTVVRNIGLVGPRIWLNEPVLMWAWCVCQGSAHSDLIQAPELKGEWYPVGSHDTGKQNCCLLCAA